MSKNLLPLLACTAALFFSSCAGLSLKQDLDSEVKEVQDMRSELEGSWSEIESRLAKVESDVANFGPSNNQVQNAAYYEAVGEEILREDTDVIVEAGARVANTDVLEAAFEGASEGTHEEMDSMRAEGKRIMAELRSELPREISAMTGEATEVAVRTAKIRVAADQTRSIAEKNPLMSSADRDSLDEDDRQIDSEIQSLTDLVDRISQSSGGYSSRIAAALARFEAKLGSR